MKKYIFLLNNKVHEIVDEYDAIFPNIPIHERYSNDFLDKCIIVEDDDKIPQIGSLYENGVFLDVDNTNLQ